MNDQLTISCGEGSILIQEIQRPGKRAQKTKEFLLGFSIPIEERVN